MNIFEKTLRLLLKLQSLISENKGDTEEADAVRDELDIPYGWCNPLYNLNDRLTGREKEVLELVLSGIDGNLNKE